MSEIRRKQKKLYRAMRFVAIFGAIFLFVYIGAQPYVKAYSLTLATICSYLSDGIVIAILALVFIYYSKYAKADAFLTSAEDEINDYGYYISSRTENNIADYLRAVSDDLSSCGFAVNTAVEANDFEFDFKATKSKQFFYAVNIDYVDKNDIIAHLDAVIYDLTVKNIKRKGNAVLFIITNKADDSAIELSKMITPLGRKNQLKIAIAIVEIENKNTYFLGNVTTKCSLMISNFVMNCDVPIKDKYVHKEKLPFQYALAEKMETFTLSEFKSGNFYIH